MPIPDVPLNIDPSGYAGSIVRPIRVDRTTRSRRPVQPFRIPKLGRSRSSGLRSFLKKQAQQRERIANAQLKALRQETSQDRRAFNREELERRNADFRAQQAQSRRPSRARRPIFGDRGPARVSERGRAGMMAQAALASPGTYRGDPFGAQNIQNMIASIGIPAAQQGLMQTGQLLGQQGRGGVVSGPEAPPRRNPYGWMEGLSGTTQLPPYEGGTLPGYGENTRDHPFFTNAPSNFDAGSLPGTLEKDQEAKLHEGEVVISADQVDEPLMRFLIGDKLRKMQSGQMNGKGTGPGDMPSYQGGNIPRDIFPDDQPELDRPELGYMGIIPETQRSPSSRTGQFWKDYVDAYRSQLGGREEAFGRGILPGIMHEAGLGADIVGKVLGIGGDGEAEAESLGLDTGSPAPEPSEPEVEELSLAQRMLESAEQSREQEPAFEVGTKGYIESQKAKLETQRLRQQAETMQSWLIRNVGGGGVSPEMYKSMMDQVTRYDKLADASDKRREKAEGVATATRQAGEERVQSAYAKGIEAEVTQEDRKLREVQREARDLTKNLNSIRSKWIDEEDSEKKSGLLAQMVGHYREREALAGNDITGEEARLYVMTELELISEEELAEELMNLGKVF